MNNSNLKNLILMKEFLIYLDGTNILKELLFAGIEFEKSVCYSVKNKNFNPPFRFRLQLDLIKLQDISENLYMLFIKEPKLGIQLSKNTILSILNFTLTNVRINKNDLQIVPLVLNLPITNEIMDLFLYPSHSLESIQGVLVAKTSIIKYKRSSVCRCELQSCPENQWQRYPENHENWCSRCFSFMEEDVSLSDTGEEIICQFLPLKAYHTSSRCQTLKVKIRDEICTLVNLVIGEVYIVTGILNYKSFETMNLQFKNPTLKATPIFPQLESLELPQSIMTLYLRINKENPNCPWSFVVALSSLLASRLIPVSSFLHLKVGLMLNLLTHKLEESPVPLLAIGADSLNTKCLFQTAGKLAERYVNYSVAHSYLGGATKLGFQLDAIWEEAGQLILAAKGVCDLGDWSKYKKEQSNYICQTVDRGQVVMSKSEIGKSNFTNIVPLKCSVWTYWCHITSSRNDQLQLKRLINVFGIPFLAEEKNEKENEKIARKYLYKELEVHDKIVNIDNTFLKDLKSFIEIISSKELTISEKASQLIRNYFVITRRERPHCLPIGAIKTMTSLAEAHARLAFRNEVLYEDVVAIIYLYEEAISTLFGNFVNSYPKLTWDQNEPIYAFKSRQLRQFQIWLEGSI